jgi:hypothetical protein
MFVQVIQARCSRAAELRDFSRSWKSDLGPGATGWLGGTFGVTDDGEFLAVVRFESREAAAANSARPEQGAWAEQLTAHLDGPPTFDDYDDVTLFLDGGSDDAGFVQVIRGQVADVDGAKALLANTDELRRMRPGIIGGTFAVAPDGSYTETVAFSDESSARAGEQLDPPAEVRAALEDLLAGARFYDLRDPWFESAD